MPRNKNTTSKYKSPSVHSTPSYSPSTYAHESRGVTIGDGIKWGLGSSIGHSIGNIFGFGTQHVKVDNPIAVGQNSIPSPAPAKTFFDYCMESNIMVPNKLSYCNEYDKCIKDVNKTGIYANCDEEARLRSG